jgi:hypothetical protein
MAKRSSSGLQKLGLAILVILVAAVFLTAVIVQKQTRTESEASLSFRRANLFAIPGEVVAGDEIYAIWVNNNMREEDWVGLYLKGADNSAPLEKKLLKDCESVSRRSRQKVGMCSFTVPSSGSMFEFRMFSVLNIEDRIKTTPRVTPRVTKAPRSLIRERHVGTSNPITVTTVTPSEVPTVTPSITP